MIRMKESGIDWIGQIPEEWKISKIKFTTQLNGRIGWQGLTSAEYKEEGPYLITGTDFQNGTINFETAVHIDERRWSEASQIQVKNGDLLITKDGTVGKVAIISGLDGKASLNSGVLRIQTIEEIDRRFLYYVLLSDEFWMWFNYTNSGASTILHLYQNVFDEFTFTFPQKNEQQKIADYLDKKIAQLDRVKRLLEKQIQKLKDYRASLIYEIVTKGLDKTVPMKDSGIDWIGQVPEGWGVKPLKYLTEFKNGYAFDSKNLTMEQTGVKVIRIGDFKSSGIDFNAALNVFTSFNSKLDFYRVKKSQILIAMSGATVGKISFVNQEPNVYSVINQRVGIIESKINKWIYYCLSTDSFMSYIQLNSNGSAQPNISSSEISDFKVVIPDDVAIQRCVKYLDNQFDNINKLIQIKNKQIKNINKQRQTLIYDYVTGKRRV